MNRLIRRAMRHLLQNCSARKRGLRSAQICLDTAFQLDAELMRRKLFQANHEIMIPTFFEKLLGPSWRTTLASGGTAFMALLAFLAALPDTVSPLLTFLPPEWHSRITIAAAFAAALLHYINGKMTKDVQVSGNGTLTKPSMIAQPDGSNKIPVPTPSPSNPPLNTPQ